MQTTNVLVALYDGLFLTHCTICWHLPATLSQVSKQGKREMGDVSEGQAWK